MIFQLLEALSYWAIAVTPAENYVCESRMSRSNSISRTPELHVALLSFAFHFVWEFIQAPTYADMVERPHWDGIKLCTSATFGDVGFALTAFWITALLAKSRYWIAAPKPWQIGVFVAIGILLTVGFEYYYTQVSLRWTYSELMPLVPPFGTGLSPLLQWLVIPSLVIWYCRLLLQNKSPSPQSPN